MFSVAVAVTMVSTGESLVESTSCCWFSSGSGSFSVSSRTVTESSLLGESVVGSVIKV